MKTKDGKIPTLFVEANSIPEAHYKAIKSVWEKGVEKRTQYDRKDDKGNYIDPPGKDAQVLIKINDPFKQPRYPPLSFCERGKYILEMLGIKNHLVIPRKEILSGVEEGNLSTRWPYAYHQRLSDYPVATGNINQIENIIERLTEDMNTRRAAITTRAPEIDVNLQEDIPCLGEIHFRCFEDEKSNQILNMTTLWRSRDLFKAWADNTIALTYLGRKIAKDLENKTGIKTILGGYTDYSNSLHIYGQDFSQIQGEKETEKKGFFEVFPDVKSYINRSMDSVIASEYEILPQMKELLSDTEKEQWSFSEKEIKLIEEEIELLEKGLLP